MGGYDHRPLAGIGGWLTFFLLVIGVLTPLRIVVETVGFYSEPNLRAYFGERWSAVATWQGMLTAIQLGGFGFMTWRMIKVQTWQSVRIAIGGLWILQLGMMVLDLVMMLLLSEMSTADLLAGAGILPLQAVIFATVWTAYLLRSERVANTYPKDVEAEVAEVFS